MRTPADLRRIFHAIDLVFFGGACEAAGLTVRWKAFRDSRTMFMFGEFCPERRQVRVNRRLAALDVPEHVVCAVCYHEMLHHVVGLEHDVEFQKAEHRFPHYYQSEQWCEKFILDTLECS